MNRDLALRIARAIRAARIGVYDPSNPQERDDGDWIRSRSEFYLKSKDMDEFYHARYFAEADFIGKVCEEQDE